MMRINVELLKGALKKLKGFAKDTIVMEFTAKAEKGTDDERYLVLTASNGIAQASVLCSYTGEDAEKKYIVSAGYVDVVETISAFGEEILIEEKDGCLKLECGDAIVPVELLKDAMSLKMASVKKAGVLHINVDSAKFAELVAHGGYATGDASMQFPLFNGTVIFLPYEEKGEVYLRALSCCGAFFAGATTTVEVKDTELFSKFAADGKTIAVNFASIMSLSRRFVNECIDVFITDKQMIIRDGVDAYVFTTVDGKVPRKIISVACEEVEKGFSYSLDRDTLKKALNLAEITGDDKVHLSFENESLVVSDTEKGNRACVPLTTIKGGKAEFTFLCAFLKRISSSMPAELVVYTPLDASGLYFEGKDCKSYIIPLKGV